MTNLGSVTICGKRGGKSFATASRPVLDGTCSDGLIPCSNSTSLENTICVSIEDQLAGKCPITDIMLIDQLQAENLDPEFYEAQYFTDDFWLVYSKTQNDNLPLMAG